MSTYISKSKPYVEQYNDFIKTKKTFTVKFYRKYEGEGGYWDCNDEWVDGPTVIETVAEETFDDLISAFRCADTIQEMILAHEREKYIGVCKKYNSKEDPETVYWVSECNFNFHNQNNHDLISAHINWDGSDFNMDITYNIIE